MPETANYKWDTSDLLGEGAYGMVYKGIGSNKEIVAIKTFQFTLNSFILREAATMAKTNHENIVRFYSLEKMLNSYKKVIVMEICDGNVENLIKKNQNGFTSSEFKRFCQQFVSALHHLRNNDIIHRDIKPGNILLVHNNDQIIYKLADFGAARFLKANESYSSLYGTYEYSHPDIFAKFYAKALNVSPSKQEFNDFHELWSLGVTLFEVASGRLPFDPKEGRDKPQVMYDMIAQKGRECISAREVDGKIEWFKELPENCKLDDDLKHAITPLISGLLQSSNEWSFERFFKEASRTLTPKKDRLPLSENVLRHRQKPKHSKKSEMQLRKKRFRSKIGEIQWWRRR